MARKTVGLGLAIALLVMFGQSALAQDNYQTDTEETPEAGRATIGGPIYAYVAPASYDITVTGTTPDGVSMYQFEYYENGVLKDSKGLGFGTSFTKVYNYSKTALGTYTYRFRFRGIGGAHGWPPHLDVSITIIPTSL